ncbi:MAG TPA: SDR family oxidoreductase [Mycobacteriales bacterium]|nr:SDR family oxidoreductase [Mycobacteriales bacterium]
MPVDPAQRVAVVSGGASGIGAAVARRLRAAGHQVVVLDRAEPCDVGCDVSDADAVDAAMATVVRDAGVPTRIVASAGIGHSATLLDLSVEDFRRVLDVNLLGGWLVLRAAAKVLIEVGAAGSMVAVSSISGDIADRAMGAYCASKAALDMLVRVAAVEWGRHRIRVNAVGPGVTRTPMLGDPGSLPGWESGLTQRTALGRLGEPDDVADAVAGLLELEWVTGQVLHADGGLSLHSPIDAYGTAQRARRG